MHLFCVLWGCTCVLQHRHAGQRATFRNPLLPSIMLAVGIKLGLLSLTHWTISPSSRMTILNSGWAQCTRYPRQGVGEEHKTKEIECDRARSGGLVVGTILSALILCPVQQPQKPRCRCFVSSQQVLQVPSAGVAGVSDALFRCCRCSLEILLAPCCCVHSSS